MGARLRELYAGNLCVTEGGRPTRELDAIARRVIAGLPPAYRLGGGSETIGGHVDIDVVLDNGDLQRSVDARYGLGVVRIRSALIRVG